MYCIVPNPQIPEGHVSELWAVGTRTEAKMLDVARIPLSKIRRRKWISARTIRRAGTLAMQYRVTMRFSRDGASREVFHENDSNKSRK
jgi:hypothetical protein